MASTSSGPTEADPPRPALHHGKLFVGGVPVGTPEGVLRDHFSRFGEVAAVAVPTHRRSGKPRGFAFVQFVQSQDAESAITAGRERHIVNGAMLDVKVAEPKRAEKILQSEQASQHHFPNDDHQHSPQNPMSRKIFIGGLPSSVDDDQLRDYFLKFGAITRTIVVTDQDTNVSRGFGFVEFASEESAKRVMEKERHCLGGQWAEVKDAVTKYGGNPERRMASSSGLSSHAPPYYPADNVRLVAGVRGYFVPGVFIYRDTHPAGAGGVTSSRMFLLDE